jgi:hypothetical protein
MRGVRLQHAAQAPELEDTELRQALTEVSVRAGVAAAQLGLAAEPATHGPLLPARLHALFSFRPAAAAPQLPGGSTSPSTQLLSEPSEWCAALEAVAGPCLNAIVVPTTSDATALLQDPAALRRVGGSNTAGGGVSANGGNTRLWPLDRLTAPDLTERQRAARDQLGHGETSFSSVSISF